MSSIGYLKKFATGRSRTDRWAQLNLLGLGEEFDKLQEVYLEKGCFFVAEDPKCDLIGMVGLKHDSDKVVFLKRLVVAPRCHRKGVASGLIKECISWSRKNGYASIELATGEKEVAKSLYERLGFMTTKRDPLNKDYLMRLELN